ncbi:MAG TPA: alpha/beta hydrolase [Polyangiaceae bacterium]|nr:alpha/beta hydrolase [Polyangiaceae bacterium]
MSRGAAQCVLAAILALATGACSERSDEHATGCPTKTTSGAVHVSNGIGTLGGALTLPAGCGPFPVLLIIAGSGATDRDGNQLSAGVRPDTYLKVANALAPSGVATLRFDKAGVGESLGAAPKQADQRFEDVVADAALWLDWLRADSRFDAVIVAGHSEGALVGLLLARSKPVEAYVSLEGAGRPIDVILREQLAQNTGLSADVLTAANSILDELLQGRAVASVPAELAWLFAPALQPYIMSWMRYDPAAEFAKTTMPALVVQGTADTQVSLVDAELLSKARPDARELIVEDMSHFLKPATLDVDSQMRSWRDPSLPVRSEVIDAIRALVNEVAPGQP